MGDKYPLLMTIGGSLKNNYYALFIGSLMRCTIYVIFTSQSSHLSSYIYYAERMYAISGEITLPRTLEYIVVVSRLMHKKRNSF